MTLPDVTVIAVFEDIEDEATKQAIYSAEQSEYDGDKHLILMCTMYAEGQTDFSMFVFAAIQADTEYVAMISPGDNWEPGELDNWIRTGQFPEALMHLQPRTPGMLSALQASPTTSVPLVWKREQLLEEHGQFWLEVLRKAEEGKLN